jgi:hypothetical protein
MKQQNDKTTKRKTFSKGDLVVYFVEVFSMSSAAGYHVEKQDYIGVVISDIVHAKYYSPDGSCYTYGYPIIDKNEMHYCKIYCFETQQVVYISYDKIILLHKCS